jgi:hypothetical protein
LSRFNDHSEVFNFLHVVRNHAGGLD